MDKNYRISYKVYPNDRLKKVDFHGKSVFPLYIQLTFNRKTTYYKSSLFALFIKPKYRLWSGDKIIGPTLQTVKAKESELIQFIIEKHTNDFSLEIFKKDYDFYSYDLLDVMERPFLDYLHSFFHTEGMPFLADTLKAGAEDRVINEVIVDLQKALKPALYDKLIAYSLTAAPPYPLLYGFAAHRHPEQPASFTFKDWEQEEVKAAFLEYVSSTSPERNLPELKKEIEKWRKTFRVASR